VTNRKSLTTQISCRRTTYICVLFGR